MLPNATRAPAPPRRIVARLARAGLIAAGATAAAIAVVDCGDSASPLYGAGTDEQLLDASIDVSSDVRLSFDAAPVEDVTPTEDAADGSLDASPPMIDAAYGGPPFDAGTEAD